MFGHGGKLDLDALGELIQIGVELGSLFGRFNVPKSMYVLLVLLYVISNVMLSGIARNHNSQIK